MGNETWVQVNGYEGYYEINAFGEVKSLNRIYNNRSIKGQSLNSFVQKKSGYICISLRKAGKQKQHYLHKLLAVHFIPNPENKPEVNHINGVKNDYRIENLEWATKSENILHSFDVLGKKATKFWTNKKGADHCRSKKVRCVNTDEVFVSCRDAAEKLGLNSSNIVLVCNKKYQQIKGYKFEYV